MAKRSEDVNLPPDLRKVLASDKEAQAKWDGLTPIAKIDFISWIDDAKQEETRKRRIMSVPSRLASGKRRPCCYAVVPMDLYKALGNDKKAKAQWSSLNPLERREFISWVYKEKEKQAHKLRIEKACAMLTQKKRHP